MEITRESVAEFMAGNGTVGTTPAKLTAAPYPVLKHVVVRAAAGNSNTIKVGTSEGQVTNGFILAASEQTPPIYVDDTSKVWLVGGAADQAYNWIAN